MKIPSALSRYVAKETPVGERMEAAGGEDPSMSALSPSEKATVFFALSFDSDAEVAEKAKKSLESFTGDLAVEALHGALDPLVIRRLVALNSTDGEVLVAAATNPASDTETLLFLANSGPEEVVSALAAHPERLEEHPGLTEAVKARTGEDLSEGVDPALMEEAGDASVEDRQNIHQLVQALTVAQKIKLALTGNKSAREVLIKDSNKMISLSVLKNPRITEEEVRKVVGNKATPDDLLRAVARNREWMKDYQIKHGMVNNAKTPLTISLRLLDQLYKKDLEKLAKSKNIPSVLSSTAKRKVESKQR